MQRNRFIASLLTLVAAPLSALSAPRFFGRNDRGFKIAAGEGRKHGHLHLKGVNENVIDVKISGTDTDGGIGIFEQTSLSQGRGTPLHVHHNQDEIFYVLEGSYRFRLGEELHNLVAGDSIFLPRKVPHAWSQVSKKGKMMVTLQPAGKLEDFFVTLAALQHVPDAEEMARMFAANDMEVLGPPLKVD